MDWLSLYILPFIVSICLRFGHVLGSDVIQDGDSADRFKIDGKIDLTVAKDKDWMTQTRVLVDGGEYLGYLRYISPKSNCSVQ